MAKRSRLKWKGEDRWIHGLSGLYRSPSWLVFSICLQRSRPAAMALRRLLAEARGGIALPAIYLRKCMYRYRDRQFVSSLARCGAVFRLAK
jgi:hypothetical protein